MALKSIAAYNLARRFDMNYKVVVNESEEGFSISCPGLPGCWSQGETEAEALANIQDAIREYLAAIDDLVKGQDVREVRVAV
jgi:predicted RNase H-like HicB family nuclease